MDDEYLYVYDVQSKMMESHGRKLDMDIEVRSCKNHPVARFWIIARDGKDLKKYIPLGKTATEAKEYLIAVYEKAGEKK